eukprot:m.240134 g.240134  ORF g.240134 m.240134 type:complete len:66 (+) comp40193_c0_seq15:492-689(+)
MFNSVESRLVFMQGDKDSVMLTYFGFLTIMCFRIFLAEKVGVKMLSVATFGKSFALPAQEGDKGG